MTPNIYMLCPPPGSRIPAYVTAVDRKGEYLFAGGYSSNLLTSAFVHLPTGVEVTDRMLTSGVEIILSPSASSVLSRLRLCPSIIRGPCELIKDHNQAKPGTPYELWYSAIEHDVIDRERSNVRSIRNHIVSVFDWALSAGALPDLDLFVGPTGKWFVTEQLVAAVFGARLTGFGFLRIPCH